jgi:hypothetical protein
MKPRSNALALYPAMYGWLHDRALASLISSYIAACFDVSQDVPELHHHNPVIRHRGLPLLRLQGVRSYLTMSQHVVVVHVHPLEVGKSTSLRGQPGYRDPRVPIMALQVND